MISVSNLPAPNQQELLFLYFVKVYDFNIKPKIKFEQQLKSVVAALALRIGPEALTFRAQANFDGPGA